MSVVGESLYNNIIIIYVKGAQLICTCILLRVSD